MPKEPNEFTQDYSTKKVHRFALSSNAMKHICSPSNVLHIANLPPNLTDDELVKVFSQFGQVRKVKITPGTPRSNGYAKMERLDDAVTAMATLNQTKLDDSMPIRVSFTKLTKIDI
jgi:RNA recognition motif-containing protein